MPLVDKIRFFAVTDVGRKRAHNEDSFLVDEDMNLFVVADGMGGHAAGEVASSMAVRIVHEVLAGQTEVLADRAAHGPRSEVSTGQILKLLEHAVHTASKRIHAEAQADSSKRGMGTTLSLLLLIGSRGYVAHVGDSRIYLIRDGVIRQVTEDHTIANELLRLGMVTPEDVRYVPNRNAITRAVGVYQHAEVDTLNLEVLPNDQFVLSSDGLTGYLDDAGEVMLEHLSDADGEQSVQGLIDFANGKGGKDNITVVLIRLGRGGTADSVRARRLELTREVLHGMPMFSRLNERELLRVMQTAEVYQFDRGEVVVREGDLGDQMFVTLQGQLRIKTGQAVLGEIGPGEHLGEMSLIRSTPRSATAIAIEPTELIGFRRADFFQIIRSEPHIAVKLLWQFLNVFADRLEQTSRDLSTAREKLDRGEDDRETAPPPASWDVVDPFTPPVMGGLGRHQLGFQSGTPMESPPSTVDNAPPFGGMPDGAGRIEQSPAPVPDVAHRIADSPSFDDAPDMAQRIDDSPSLGDAPEMAHRIADSPFLDEAADATPRVGNSPSRSNVDEVNPRGDDDVETSRGRQPSAEIPANTSDDVSPDLPKTRPGSLLPHREPTTRPVPQTVAQDLVEPTEESEPREARARQSTMRSAGNASISEQVAAGLGEELKETVPDRGVRGTKNWSERDAAGLPEEAGSSSARTPNATVPLGPQDELQNELDALRTEFKERLEKSRKERGGKDSD